MKTRALRVGASAWVAISFCLESGCGTGAPVLAPTDPTAQAPSSSPFKENLSSSSEILRARAWDQTRRFKALFKAEVSPRAGAIGRGYLSVWWDGATGTLTWRASAPIAGSGKGGVLRKGKRGGDSPLPGNLDPTDLISCILGSPAEGSTRSTLLDNQGRVVEMRFPKSEVVAFQPGEGVPRRIEANGPDGRAVLTLEAYSSWPESEEIPLL
ncbi:MAG: hypothetical protein NEA02_16940 [Thermoanaerobaculia bacterium]|nr:hypothetical protein [Thermoanaerobaculia bacterium]